MPFEEIQGIEMIVWKHGFNVGVSFLKSSSDSFTGFVSHSSSNLSQRLYIIYSSIPVIYRFLK